MSDRCHANGLPAPPPDEAMAVDRVLQRDFPRVRPERLNYLVNISLKLRYLYVEVPKVACSSIKRTLQQLEDENRSPPEDVHDRDASPLMAPYDSLSLYLSAQHDPRFRRFAFVRNPFTRTLSCYLDKCVQSPWERARLLPELGLSGDTIPTMHEFLLAVQRQPTPQMDIHWLPQAVILEGLCEPRFIGSFESYPSQFEEFLRRVTGQAGLAAARHAPHATGAGARLREYVGSKEQELIVAIYAEDFERFGYSRDLPT